MKRIAKFFTSIGASTCIVVLAAIGSSGIIWWVNESWSTDNSTYLGVLDNLRLARSELLNGYLLTEKHLSGERELADSGRCAYFEQATWRIDDALAALEPLRTKSGFRNGYRVVSENLTAYKEIILKTAGHVCGPSRQTNESLALLELRRGMGEAETRHARVSTEIHSRFRILAKRHDTSSIVLIACWAGVLLLVAAGSFLAARKRRQTENALMESEQRFRLLVESAQDAVFFQQHGRFAYLNPAGVALFGANSPEELVGTPVLERFHPDDRAAVAERIRTINEGKMAVPLREEQILRLDGSFVTVEVAAVPVTHGGIAGALVQARDITERKKSETRLLASLHEKDVLIKEVHHRVKNNLQIIISLMNLQYSETDSPQETERFKQLEGRVRSMALIHEQLYRSEDFALIDMADYIAKLLSQISQAMGSGIALRLETNLEPVLLGIDKAVPCGLLVNELATNAFKHAFAGRDSGVLRVSLNKEGRHVRLRVHDDGPGFQGAFPLTSVGKLGMLLAGELTRQLDGELVRCAEEGACVEVIFPF